jgi:hypothetical protein
MTTRTARSLLGSRIHVSRTSAILLAGDLVAIGLFVAAGEIQHGRAIAQGAPTFAQFAAGWLLAAVVVGAYAADAVSSLSRTVALAGGGWLLGASIGQLIRAIIGRGFFVLPAFYLVTLGVGGALLIGWRLLARALL